MKSILIRYAKVQYSNNLYNDYYLSGFLKKDFDICITEIKNDLLKSYKKIYCSQSKQSIQTANLLGNNVNILPELKNIKHDLSKFTDKGLRSNLNENVLYDLRKNFIQEFVNDNLIEKKKNIYLRFQSLDILTMQEEAIFITHGIVLILFEVYKKGLFEASFDEVIKHIDISKPFYGALKGYYSDLSDYI